jgi:hypothetical protein
LIKTEERCGGWWSFGWRGARKGKGGGDEVCESGRCGKGRIREDLGPGKERKGEEGRRWGKRERERKGEGGGSER